METGEKLVTLADLKVAYDAIASELNNNDRSIITVGSVNCDYATIAAAINKARQIITTTGKKVLIQLAPEVYNEEITLNPNPGISFLGYGAIISTQSSYPNAPLYTVGGDGIYYVGITFYQTRNDDPDNPAYGCHIEAQNAQNYSGGNTYFVDCAFISNAHAGLGMGLGSQLYYRFINCGFYTNAQGGVGLYTHNYPSEQSGFCQAEFHSCHFHGKVIDIQIEDAARMQGRNNRSVYVLAFNNCVGDTHKIRVKVNNTDEYTSIKEAVEHDDNFVISPLSVNNIALPGVDYYWGYFKDAISCGAVTTAPYNRIAYTTQIPSDLYNLVVDQIYTDGTYAENGLSTFRYGLCTFINIENPNNITHLEALITCRAL